ncbi:hypothetical protein GLOIN_2v1844827 [Rhizophagus clarus]|uniref:Uncharacterized protein n=1 Tax=Rhizophagus clarus TaxID=94130 RepID=A0A8H3LEF8_9GLOM|nr:hypothetical protein GLOIN_2v1844827 [Rhizophagus clarus]
MTINYVCHGYYSRSFAALARYGTSTLNYKILRDDDLFDRNVKYMGTFKATNVKNIQHLNIVLNTNHPGNTKSTELQQLQKYIEKEMKDYSYYTMISKYPTLGHIIEAVEIHGFDD